MREDFPYFRENNEVYFDNASTTQKPDTVIEKINDYLSEASNIGRGSYTLANNTTREIENVRKKISEFIGANPNEIVFTSGATQSLNMIPDLISEDIQDGEKILISKEDHKSTKKPWYKLQKRLQKQGKEIEIEEYKVLKTGDPDIEDILEKTDENTYLISITHIHNTYGGKAEVKRLSKKLEYDPLISLDACQSIAHVPIDVESLGVDFLAFSGHKMFANTGIGGLYVREDNHDTLKPHYVGGGQDKDEIPHMLERGTPNISGILSLGSATDHINQVGLEKIQQKNLELTEYLIKELRRLGVEFEKGPAYASCEDVGYGIVSFKIPEISAKDIAFILNSQEIYVRDGKHCREDGENSVRVSMQYYNTKKEIDQLIDALSQLS